MSAFGINNESTIIFVVALIIEDHYIPYYTRTVRNESIFYGERWLCQLLEQGHVWQIHENLRMDCDTFLKLSKWLQDRRGLRNARRVSARQKLAIFLMITGQGMSQRDCGTLPALSTDNLKRSKAPTFESILTMPHRCFNETFLALLHLHEAYVCLASLCDPVPPRIAQLLEYNPYFSDCLYALDGTHIDAFVSGARRLLPRP